MIFFILSSGYDGDDESGATSSSCSLQQYIRPYEISLNSGPSGGELQNCDFTSCWTTLSSEKCTVYSLPQNQYKFVEDLKIPRKQFNGR